MIRTVYQRSRVSVLATVCALGVAIGFQAPASAATYTAVPNYSDTDGGLTSLLGINNAGWLTGSAYYGSNATGLVRNAAGTYTTFSVNNFTQGRAISETNVVSGYANDGTNFSTGTEFVRAADGTLTTLHNPVGGANIHGIAQGMNASGAIVGDYFVSPTTRHGYLFQGGVLTDLLLPGLDVTRARGITNAGDIAGWTTGPLGIRGFVLSGGNYSFYTVPVAGALGTTFEDLNNFGIAVGNYSDAGGNSHGFFYDTNTSIFTELHVAGATTIQAFGINDHGQIILSTNLATGPRNFIYDPNGVPEPATWAMLLMGFTGLGVALRRRRALATA